jgi:pyridoxal biosynthesis lyase PdxS
MTATQQNTTTSGGATTRKVDQDRFDAAMLRISCASSMMMALSIYQSEDPEGQPSSEVLASALYGVALMVDDAYKGIAESMEGGAA